MFKFVVFPKVPEPFVLHCPPVATVTIPEILTIELFAQTVWSKPAFTVGAGSNVKVIMSEVGKQTPVDVSVKSTLPAVISAKLGVYIALKLVLSEKLPDPEVVQIPVVAPPETEPFNVAVVLAQIVWSAPALEIISDTNSEKYPYLQPLAPPPLINPIAKILLEFDNLQAIPWGIWVVLNAIVVALQRPPVPGTTAQVAASTAVCAEAGVIVKSASDPVFINNVRTKLSVVDLTKLTDSEPAQFKGGKRAIPSSQPKPVTWVTYTGADDFK